MVVCVLGALNRVGSLLFSVLGESEYFNGLGFSGLNDPVDEDTRDMNGVWR